MELGRYVDGRDLSYDESSGTFSSAGRRLRHDEVISADDRSEIQWVSEPMRQLVRTGLSAEEVVPAAQPSPRRKPLASRSKTLAGLSVLLVLALATAGVAQTLQSQSEKARRSSQNVALSAPRASATAGVAGSAAVEDAGQQAGLKAAPEASSAAEAKAAGESEAAAEDEPAVRTISARVVRVVDGDTAVFRLSGGVEEKVRFIGIDTPESTKEVEPYGKEASAYTRKALPEGKRVYLEKDVEARDRYGRLLAYIWLERPAEVSSPELRDKLFNAQLAIDGYAQQMTIPPNVKYAAYFQDYVAEARSFEKGLWAPAAPKKPKRDDSEAKRQDSATYIANRRSRKFHFANCRWVAEMSEWNKVRYDSRQKVVADGYVPCKVCRP